MRESQIYTPFLRFLNLTFEPQSLPASGTTDFHAQIVTDQRQMGTWSNPDLISIRFWNPAFSFDAQLFVRTYELKIEGACNTPAIHQTLAHRSSAHEAYLVGYEPSWKSKVDYTHSVRMQCRHFGLGLIFIEDLDDHSSYAVLEKADPIKPSPEKTDALLARHLNEDGKKRIRSWRRQLLNPDDGIENA